MSTELYNFYHHSSACVGMEHPLNLVFRPSATASKFNYLPKTPLKVECNTKSFLRDIKLVWTESFSFSKIDYLTKAKVPSLPYYLFIAEERGEQIDSCLSQWYQS